jgi:hypothetical protein
MSIFRSRWRAIATRAIVGAIGLLIVPSAVIAIAGSIDNIHPADVAVVLGNTLINCDRFRQTITEETSKISNIDI